MALCPRRSSLVTTKTAGAADLREAVRQQGPCCARRQDASLRSGAFMQTGRSEDSEVSAHRHQALRQDCRRDTSDTDIEKDT